MVHWKDRHILYKASFSGLALGSLTFVIAFSLPHWSTAPRDKHGHHHEVSGLWQNCSTTPLTCSTLSGGEANSDWLTAVRVMTSIAAVLLTISCLATCYSPSASSSGHSRCKGYGRHSDCLAMIATTIGTIGCAIYMVSYKHLYTYQSPSTKLYSAFYAACVAMGVIGVCSCVMFAFRKPVHRRRVVTAYASRSSNTNPVGIQLPVETENETVHIPYFGDVTSEQLVIGATPMQPPSYESITEGDNCRRNSSEEFSMQAPPSYDEAVKDTDLLPVHGEESRSKL